jgi:hypothetical protein
MEEGRGKKNRPAHLFDDKMAKNVIKLQREGEKEAKEGGELVKRCEERRSKEKEQTTWKTQAMTSTATQ